MHIQNLAPDHFGPLRVVELTWTIVSCRSQSVKRLIKTGRREYRSLKDFVEDCTHPCHRHSRQMPELVRGGRIHYTFSVIVSDNRRMSRKALREDCLGSGFVLLDRANEIVPAAAIIGAIERQIAALRLQEGRSVPGRPIAYTRCLRGGGSYFRHPHTRSELRDIQEERPDGTEPQVRPRRRRFDLPTERSEIARSCERSWKRQRPKQWKK